MREKINFNQGWLFHAGEVERPYPRQKGPLYTAAKTETRIWGPAAKTYNDRSDGYGVDREACTEQWEPVELPHDFTIGQTPDAGANVTLGFLPLGCGWYRKHFRLSLEDEGKRLTLYFEGLGNRAEVYINGCLAVRHVGDAVPFEADITDFVHTDGADNVAAVRVDNTEAEGWWYGGGGIYRPVWLCKTETVAVDLFGVYVHPEQQAGGEWAVPAEVTLRNDGVSAVQAELRLKVLTPDGRCTARCTRTLEVPPFAKRTVHCEEMTVAAPQLWSCEDPQQYTMETAVYVGGEQVDEVTTRFGFRTIRFDPQTGFWLNGRPVKIRGVCCHQDYGLTGKAVPERVQCYRLRLLREMGANGYRTAHYPHSEATMDALDELGFLVMDETRWFSGNPQAAAALQTLVRRDRNRPGVILWSIGNEEPLSLSQRGRKIAVKLRELVRQLDDRPVTSAISHNPVESAVAGELDVIGINYNIDQFDQMHEKYPDIPILASECCAVGSTRGWYWDTNRTRAFSSAYDHGEPNDFSTSRERTWKHLAARDWVAGGYQWAGIEHRGEGGWWPRLGSVSGAIDMFLQKKDAFYQNLSYWSEAPMVHLLPAWNWAGFEGREIDVWAYTNCEEAELFLNGRSLGRVTVERYGHAAWKVPYESGRLECRGYRSGEQAASDARETTGAPAALMLRCEDDGVGINDAAILTCYAVDAQGRAVPDASPMVSFDCNALGWVAATGACNTDPVPPHYPERRMWQGLCSVLVRTGGQAGVLEVYARSEGLKSAWLRLPLDAR